MISLPPGTTVSLACQPIDLRVGFDGLADKVPQITDADPSSGHVFSELMPWAYQAPAEVLTEARCQCRSGWNGDGILTELKRPDHRERSHETNA
jgi:hypothetical protein